MKINIAIDGHSSCGKSTLAKQMAKELGYVYIDSGAMYRAVALFILQNNLDVNNTDQVIEALDKINIGIEYPDGQFQINLNGEEITQRIKEMDVSGIVSEVAAISEVRKKLVKIQQQLGRDKGVVMDGRDIGTVVFPDAELKLFITAHVNVRAERRYLELSAKGNDVNLDEIKENLKHRDHIDSHREDSPLIQTEDAVLIDNSYMSKDEQLITALKCVEDVLNKKSL